MSRSPLTQETLDGIAAALPDLGSLRDRILPLDRDAIAIRFRPPSEVPVAAVSLRDALTTCFEIRFALHEAEAHRIWYEQARGSPEPATAVWCERFFLSDGAVRLYSVGEHVADALARMYGIGDSELKPYRRAHTSEQVAVGKYLVATRSGLAVSTALSALAASTDWKAARDYRNAWTHEQPPTVHGLGFIRRRTNPWIGSDPRRAVLKIRESDIPERDIADVRRFVRGAFRDFLAFLEVLVNEYTELLERNHVHVTNSNTITVSI